MNQNFSPEVCNALLSEELGHLQLHTTCALTASPGLFKIDRPEVLRSSKRVLSIASLSTLGIVAAVEDGIPVNIGLVRASIRPFVMCNHVAKTT